MIEGYKFLIPEGNECVKVTSNSIRQNDYRFYAELLDYLAIYQSGKKFIINLERVKEVDSSCVAALVGLLQATQKKGIELILEGVSSNMMHNLEVASHGSFKLFRFRKSQDA